MTHISNIFKKTNFHLYFFNTSWMLFERFVRIISGVFVGIYVARYLGPEQFGIFSYVLAIAAFVTVISCVGMDSILVRELVNRPQKKQEMMGTAFWMMMFAALLIYVFTAIVIWNMDEISSIKVFASIVTVSAFFTPFLVIDYYFQSQISAKYSAICKSFTLLLVSVIKLYLIIIEADLFWFMITVLIEHTILAVMLLVTFFIKSEKLSFYKSFSSTQAGQMLKSAWPMLLASVAVLIYMRIDQVMIRNMLSLHDVGIYSVAVKLYEAWIMLPFIITMSLLPAIAKLKQGDEKHYHKRLTQLFRLIFWLGLVALVFSFFFNELIIVFAFGEEYRSSSTVMNIIMCAAIFVSIGSISARYFSVEKMEKKIALRTIFAAIVNVVLNLILIPEYGIKGAAFATLVCTFVANYLLDWFDKDLKQLLEMKHRAIFGSPFK